MEAIILAGGFGTRLAHIVSDVPKPMAPVYNKPFLEYILKYLTDSGIDKIIMAVGYKQEIIKEYFGSKYCSCEIEYSSEDKPLFTGGAIKKALRLCKENNIFVVNGDTFFNVNIQKMAIFHKEKKSDLTLALKEMNNFDRYGTVEMNEKHRITSFKDKKYTDLGKINGGLYLMNKELLDKMSEEKFSFETDFMEKYTEQFSMYGFFSQGYFIDIGVESDYKKAQIDFKSGEYNE